MKIKEFHRRVTCRTLGHKWLPAGKVLMVCERCDTTNAPVLESPKIVPRMAVKHFNVAPPQHRCQFHWRRFGGSGPWADCINYAGHGGRHEDGNMSWVSVDFGSTMPHYWGKKDAFMEIVL